MDRRAIVAGVLDDDADLIHRYHTSAAFRHGLENAVAMLGLMLPGLIAASDESDEARAVHVHVEVHAPPPGLNPTALQEAFDAGRRYR